MILVWDNGEEYSAHWIRFIRFDDSLFSETEIVSCLPKGWKSESSGRPYPSFVIACVKDSEVDWRAPEAIDEVSDVITADYFLDDPKWNEPVRIREENWNAKMVTRLLPMWRAKPQMAHGHFLENGTDKWDRSWFDALEARLAKETVK